MTPASDTCRVDGKTRSSNKFPSHLPSGREQTKTKNASSRKSDANFLAVRIFVQCTLPDFYTKVPDLVTKCFLHDDSFF